MRGREGERESGRERERVQERETEREARSRVHCGGEERQQDAAGQVRGVRPAQHAEMAALGGGADDEDKPPHEDRLRQAERSPETLRLQVWPTVDLANRVQAGPHRSRGDEPGPGRWEESPSGFMFGRSDFKVWQNCPRSGSGSACRRPDRKAGRGRPGTRLRPDGRRSQPRALAAASSPRGQPDITRIDGDGQLHIGNVRASGLESLAD